MISRTQHLRQALNTARISIRLYSEATASTSHILYSSDASRKTVKPPTARKTYLVDRYAEILRTSPVLLLVHNNVLLKKDNATMRDNIKKAGGTLHVINTALFKVMLRGAEHEDPASEAAQSSVPKGFFHPLYPYLKGNTAVVSIPDIDPQRVQQIVHYIDRSGDRLVLLGGQVDGSLLSRSKINDFMALPSLDELRANLAGVLTVLGGAGLVQTLQAGSNVLYLTLDSHLKNESSDEPEK